MISLFLLDERFFGSREGDIAKQDFWNTMRHLLNRRERITVESFVDRNMKKSKERILVDWDDEQVKERLAGVVFENEWVFLTTLEVLLLN
jgi:hypothetical protein